MARVKRGVMTQKRHRKILKLARGYWGSRSTQFKQANEAVMHAGQYAYRDRRVRKRDFRRLWIARINAGCRQNNLTYSRFICGLTRAGVEIDRKILSDLAINDPPAFTALVTRATDALQAAAP
jgi:large subunit ribosomal protein L20